MSHFPSDKTRRLLKSTGEWGLALAPAGLLFAINKSWLTDESIAFLTPTLAIPFYTIAFNKRYTQRDLLFSVLVGAAIGVTAAVITPYSQQITGSPGLKDRLRATTQPAFPHPQP
jgi:hypothetical protein